MSNALHSIMDVTGSLLGGKQRKAAMKMARSGFTGGSKALQGAVSALRHIDLSTALAFFGLARRRGPLGTIALLGAGAAVGAGLVMLLSPTSGADVRGSLKRRVGHLGDQAKSKVEGARIGLEYVEHKAKDTVKEVEHRVEDRVSEALQKAREAARSKPA